MRRALYTVLMVGLFALALSALVVSPQEGVAEPAAAPTLSHVQAALLPQPPPDVTGAHSRPPEARAVLAALPAPRFAMLTHLAQRDSNGRVLRALRYENSVYQVFRPEVAGG